MQFVYILVFIYGLMGVAVVNAAAGFASVISQHYEDLIVLNEFNDAYDAVMEGQGGDNDCQYNIDNYMDFLDCSLLYCLNMKIDGDDSNYCTNYDEYKFQLKCGLCKEFDVYFDVNFINKSNQSYVSSISLTGKYLLTLLDDDCQV